MRSYIVHLSVLVRNATPFGLTLDKNILYSIPDKCSLNQDDWLIPVLMQQPAFNVSFFKKRKYSLIASTVLNI
jgi:hypothetical protein